MSHHSESGQNRNKRKEHDRKARRYESSTSNRYRPSKSGRTLFAVVTVILAVSFTWLFVAGWIHL
jgi:hypothetical protein